MILDSIALALVLSELKNQFSTAKIIDFHQVGQFGIMLILKTNQDEQRLFFSLRPDRMAFFLSELIPLADNHSSAFIQQLNSLLKGSRLLAIEQINFDRIVQLTIQTYHKFGPAIEYKLIIEFMGKHSNAILVDEHGFIRISFKQVGSDLNRYREIKPGVLYKSPPAQHKLNPLTISKEQFLTVIEKAKSEAPSDYLEQFLVISFQGISIKSAREITVFLNYPPEQTLTKISSDQIIPLWEKFNHLRERIIKQDISPVLLVDKNSGKAFDYSLINPAAQPGIVYSPFSRVSLCLESLYEQLNQQEKKQELYQSINKILNKQQSKLIEKEEFLEKRLREIDECTQYKQKGELLKANLWNIKPGIRQITLTDYSQHSRPAITISLNPDLSPWQNARQFFQKYKKLASSSKGIKKQLLANQQALKQLQELFSKLNTSRDSLSELITLNQKLIELNFIKIKKEGTGRKNEKKLPTILRFISTDGWAIIVGRSRQQNEYILAHLSRGNDFWLHPQIRPGAHVIIKNHQNLPSPPPDTLNLAARLAGYYSKVKDGESISIVYTLRKYLRKPRDDKAGKVIYSQEKSIVIPVNHEEIRKEIKERIQD